MFKILQSKFTVSAGVNGDADVGVSTGVGAGLGVGVGVGDGASVGTGTSATAVSMLILLLIFQDKLSPSSSIFFVSSHVSSQGSSLLWSHSQCGSF